MSHSRAPPHSRQVSGFRITHRERGPCAHPLRLRERGRPRASHGGSGGKLTALKTATLGPIILENGWYRLTLDVTVGGADSTVTGRVFKHELGSDPNSALGEQVGATLDLPSISLAAKGLLASGQVGIIASAISAVVDSSVTNFTIRP